MIFNITKRRYISYAILISLFSLASCSDDVGNGPKEVDINTVSNPEYPEEAATPAESYPENPEEVVIPTVSYPENPEEVVIPTVSYPENPEEVVIPTVNYPAYPEEVAIPVESYPAYPEEVAVPVENQPKSSENTNKIDEYSVVLGADETIKIPGIPGELRVWIGSPRHKPIFSDRMIQDDAAVPAVGESATVQPFAPAFKIDPIETQCIKIHPSGSEVRFKLIPQKHGTFEVGANVYLFDSIDCSGAPIPKIASTLKVLVEVNQKEIFSEKSNELWSVLWDKFVEFWAALVAILFGVILFLIRGKLKKWFGYEDD